MGCPTADPRGCEGFADSRDTVEAYHTAIGQSKCRNKMRLGLSWMLSLNQKYWPAWQRNADSLRLDTDINNAHEKTLVSFKTLQRAIERYRVFSSSIAQCVINGNVTHAVRIRPDMDNTFLANELSISGLHDAQRYTMAMHWSWRQLSRGWRSDLHGCSRRKASA